MRSVTPHTIAASDGWFFVLGRNATDNFVVRIPMKAVRQLLGLPRDFVLVNAGEVLDIDPETTDYRYTGKYPRFLDDGVGSTEEGFPGPEEE